jgi:heat shock protein HslJ
MKQKVSLSILIVCFSMSTFVGCKSGKLHADNPLFTNKWILYELNGAPVQTSNTDRDANINFSLADMKVTGSGGCNRFNGTFNAKGKDMSFGTLATTKMICPDSKFEDAFFAALAKVKNFEIGGNELLLKDGDKTVAKLNSR